MPTSTSSLPLPDVLKVLYPDSKEPSLKRFTGSMPSTFSEMLLTFCSMVLTFPSAEVILLVRLESVCSSFDTFPLRPFTVVVRPLAVCSTVLTLVPKELTCDAVLEICPLADFISAVLVSTSFSRPVTESVTVVTLVDNKPISPSAAVISACTFS